MDPVTLALAKSWAEGEFGDLRQLQQHIAALQTVSELAPVAGELQAVSELAPYIQAILDGRIVEMGSNSNGTYVRWENGLQIVWATRSNEISGGKYTTLDSIPLPAAFVNANYAIVAGYSNGGWRLVFTNWGKTATLITPQIYNFDSAVTANWWYAAIGRWK